MSATGSPATSPVSPSDEDLAAALKSLREANPSTGAAKLLPLLLEANPGWTVSEKRLRKALQKGGLSLAGPAASGSISEEFPTSKMIPSLDLSAWSKKIKVEDFGMKKGKGLVATKAIEEGEYLWLEDPLVFAPESSVQVSLLLLCQLSDGIPFVLPMPRSCFELVSSVCLYVHQRSR